MKLTVLSFGGGQDSTAILYRLVFDKRFRRRYVTGRLLVVFSDTGNEYPMTYLHVLQVKAFCKKHGVEFIHITPDMGFHNQNWHSLEAHYEKYDVVMQVNGRRSCTDQLKIQPIYRFLNHWLSDQYGYPSERGVYRGKYAIVCFADEYGPVRMLLGIARGEEGRLTGNEFVPPVWMQLSIVKEYPLIDVGWDRGDCQKYICKVGRPVPPPSNCMFCPFQTRQTLLLLARKYPDDFARWVEHEQRKLRKFGHLGDRNCCVLHPTKTLTQMLAEAEEEFGNWTTEQLERHRFNNGHCVLSKY